MQERITIASKARSSSPRESEPYNSVSAPELTMDFTSSGSLLAIHTLLFLLPPWVGSLLRTSSSLCKRVDLSHCLSEQSLCLILGSFMADGLLFNGPELELGRVTIRLEFRNDRLASLFEASAEMARFPLRLHAPVVRSRCCHSLSFLLPRRISAPYSSFIFGI